MRFVTLTTATVRHMKPNICARLSEAGGNGCILVEILMAFGLSSCSTDNYLEIVSRNPTPIRPMHFTQNYSAFRWPSGNLLKVCSFVSPDRDVGFGYKGSYELDLVVWDGLLFKQLRDHRLERSVSSIYVKFIHHDRTMASGFSISRQTTSKRGTRGLGSGNTVTET